jgi:hypothetical protein
MWHEVMSTVEPSVTLRDTLRSSTDPRVGRTRAAIVAAVEALVAREARPVTVADIVRDLVELLLGLQSPWLVSGDTTNSPDT